MGSTKENVSACESTELNKKANETAGEVSDSDLLDSADISVNISSEVSTPQVETSDPNSSRNEATTPASSKKGKKKSRHSKKGHTPAKETADRNVVRRVHHTAAKFKQCRKRAQSFPTISKFFLPHKRPRNEVFIPPTKFLLGGNISDPLNLNSLKDENVNRAMNAVTPESSPLPTPPRHKAKIDVIIPPNIRDPLNLMEPLDNEEYEKRLEMQQRRPRKKARLRRRTTDNTSPSRVTEEVDVKVDGIKEPPPPEPSTSASKCRKRSCSDSENASQKGKEAKKLRRMDSLDKIVSPVVPQPGAWMRARPQQRMSTSERPVSPHRTKLKSQSEEEKKLPKFHPKNSRYQFGNYDRYYGYRNLNAMMDIRLQVFEMHRHLFQNKDVLDIGCNVGHISLAVARELGARSVLGIDIDPVLIGRARKNLRSFIPVPSEPKCEDSEEKKVAIDEKKDRTDCGTNCKETEKCEECTDKQDDAKDDSKKRRIRKPRKNRKAVNREQGQCFFPMSMSLLFGPLGDPAADRTPPSFPNNVTFKAGNYVPREDVAVGSGESPQFDLILCLSTTKWMHLNWGDGGLKRAFRRMFADLRPGGKLVLEAQNWASYMKKKRMTPTIYENFNGIELFPNKFREYLLSPEVGFSKCSILGVPQHASKGFRRPIQLFVKGDFTPSKACWSDAYAPSSHHRPEGAACAPARRPVYAPVPVPAPARGARPSDDAPSCGAATPYSPNLDSCADDSPFYNPRSDSYAPSYSYQPPRPTVYASLASPRPTVYASLASPRSPRSPQGSASPAASSASPAASPASPAPDMAARARTTTD